MPHDNSPATEDSVGELDYWYPLINEFEAGDFLGLTARAMQGFRYKGTGPEYVKISSRCVRYRRIDLKRWADAKVRTLTGGRPSINVQPSCAGEPD